MPLLALGCTARQAWLADHARNSLPGLAADDLRLCAGVPDRTTRVTENGPALEYWPISATSRPRPG